MTLFTYFISVLFLVDSAVGIPAPGSAHRNITPGAYASGSLDADVGKYPGVYSQNGATGIRAPSYSEDGRLVLSVDGDIHLQKSPGEPFIRLTSGPAWDRDPVFTISGDALLFASDRDGTYSIYRMPLSADAKAGAAERLTTSLLPDRLPVEVGDRVLFVRGSGASARVWQRTRNGTVSRISKGTSTEQALTASSDGRYFAFITSAEEGPGAGFGAGLLSARRIIVKLAATQDSTVATIERDAQHLAFSPDAQRIAYATRTGTFVAPLNGSYSNLVSSRSGELAWSPVSNMIAIVSYTETSVSYNGDPDRGLDRTAGIRFNNSDSLRFVLAPEPPDNKLTVAGVSAAASRSERNADEFARLWQRTRQLYFSAAAAATQRAQWDAAYGSLRSRAAAAQSDDELQETMYELLRKRPPLRTEASGKAAVSSAHPVSTDAGLEILKAGGNVVDAAVAVSFALGVVEPDASGIGGYGQMVIALASLPSPTLIEFMSRVPEDASLSNTSLLRNGRYPPDGPVLVNVPGTVAGMYEMWKKYGSRKLEWSELLQPAIRAAQDGYAVSEGLATTLATEREHFSKYPSSVALFFRNGEPMVAGDTVRNKDLAWVLGEIAAKGADGFYTGEVAKRYVDSLHAGGNAMKLSDMARYFANERTPVSGTYRGYTLYSTAPPVSGGAELVGRLNLLEQFRSPKLYTEDALTLHAALSAWLLVPPSRGRIADPAMWPVDIAPIINRDTAAARWNCFNESRALRPADLRGARLACAAGNARSSSIQSSSHNASTGTEEPVSPCGDDHAAEVAYCHASGTTAFVVADNDGNMVAVTQTLGTWGGNFQVAPGLGFLSNDKLTSYGTDPTQYGSRLPYARHGSTIAPTVVYRNNRPVFAIGAAGNAWITSAIYQGIIGALDFNLGPQAVLELPRFLPGGGGGRGAGAGGGRYSIQMEDGFSPATIATLRKLGYDIQFVSMQGELREGYGAAIRINGKTVTAGADPRRSGKAGALRQ